MGNTNIKRIMMAEDDPRDVELTLEALSEHNIANKVDVVNDGAEALDYLYRRGNYADRKSRNPAVILLDLKMPRLNGIDVLRAIKSDPTLKTIPIVVLTSSREESDLKECYELGVNAYVVKPVEFGDFMAAIKTLGAFWAILNEVQKD
jgi:CheY-like chemotaxis protein